MTDRPRKIQRTIAASDAANTSSQCDDGSLWADTGLTSNSNPPETIEPGASGAMEPSGSVQQEKPSVRVERALTGDVLLNVTEDFFIWPDEERELLTCDIFKLLGIDDDEHCLFDLFHSVQHDEPVEEVHFGHVYILVKRLCARCNACGACCTRTEAHSLCSHGNFAHLWCRPRPVSGDDKISSRFLARRDQPVGETKVEARLCIVTVEGYSNGSGLSSRFSDDEINKELSNIARQYKITIPEDFTTRSRVHVT